jgi:hypothetical protein
MEGGLVKFWVLLRGFVMLPKEGEVLAELGFG